MSGPDPFKNFMTRVTAEGVAQPEMIGSKTEAMPEMTPADFVRIAKKLRFASGDIVRIWGLKDAPDMKVMGYYHQVGAFDADFILYKKMRIRTFFNLVWFNRQCRLEEMSASQGMLELITLGPRE